MMHAHVPLPSDDGEEPRNIETGQTAQTRRQVGRAARGWCGGRKKEAGRGGGLGKLGEGQGVHAEEGAQSSEGALLELARHGLLDVLAQQGRKLSRNCAGRDGGGEEA